MKRRNNEKIKCELKGGKEVLRDFFFLQNYEKWSLNGWDGSGLVVGGVSFSSHFFLALFLFFAVSLMGNGVSPCLLPVFLVH